MHSSASRLNVRQRFVSSWSTRLSETMDCRAESEAEINVDRSGDQSQQAFVAGELQDGAEEIDRQASLAIEEAGAFGHVVEARERDGFELHVGMIREDRSDLICDGAEL